MASEQPTDGPQISDEDDDRFGTWYLIDLKTEEVVNTFHWTSCARRKREGLIEGWPEHTEDSLVIASPSNNGKSEFLTAGLVKVEMYPAVEIHPKYKIYPEN